MTGPHALRGKVVLITGGRRVGSELARDLADAGALVAMTYHTSRAAIERTIRDVEERGSSGLAVAADLSSAEEAEAAVDAVVGRFGRLDALVNMASVYRRTPFDALVPADFDAMIAANLAAPYHTSVAAARRMLTQSGDDGISGRIISLGDWASERPYRHYLPYLVAKGALTTMTLALAKELAPHIAVAMIQPAMIDPPPDLSEADRAEVVAATPLRRCGTPGDVNRLILYLLSGTSFVTGACFRVDGGRFLGTD
ncbi:SDR family NAD(P)-dependent oxidoreductase [Aquisphaera insulae]|uniref:SDR family NAD(P)-dependent oxidoreductase n=1 Tax=Aquisphaera insulae TaxID=2712864 RepID=UPI0013ED0E0B|nr:SDR family oxidoreductase [Aquisphaera insulae]